MKLDKALREKIIRRAKRAFENFGIDDENPAIYHRITNMISGKSLDYRISTTVDPKVVRVTKNVLGIISIRRINQTKVAS